MAPILMLSISLSVGMHFLILQYWERIFILRYPHYDSCWHLRVVHNYLGTDFDYLYVEVQVTKYEVRTNLVYESTSFKSSPSFFFNRRGLVFNYLFDCLFFMTSSFLKFGVQSSFRHVQKSSSEKDFLKLSFNIFSMVG